RSSKCLVQVEDPMASREHALLHIGRGNGVPTLMIEDVKSANGTRVRDGAIKPGERVAILPGEAVMIGATVIMVLQNRSQSGPRRLWSHAYFEARVEDECARAAKLKSTFALARLRLSGAASWTRILPLLARDLAAPHVFATYGPKDYEILFVDVEEGVAEHIVNGLVAACAAAGLEAGCGVAWYPKDGRTADALIASANALLKVRPGAPAADVASAVPEPYTMQRVRDMAARVAASPINVLILGECGVGKDVLARTIHRLSPRANKPFVALNCAGLTETLMDSELFGHEKGAFTGAVGAKVGLLESADGGTVFLDEIGDMPASMQAKLLRVIETREVRPIAGLKERPINVRFISATNKDLEAAIGDDEFRHDLMYRLNGITLMIPPLRERADEIEPLARTFVGAACADSGRAATLSIAADAMSRLHHYRWPGNIRELKNMMERAVAVCDGPEIRPEHLPLEKMGVLRAEAYGSVRMIPKASEAAAEAASTPEIDPAKAAERQSILDALVACHGNQTRAAQLLGMPRRRFVSKLDLHGISRPRRGDYGQEPSEVQASPGTDLLPVEEQERRRIVDALAQCAGNQTRTAQLLGISRGTLIDRIHRFGLARPRADEVLRADRNGTTLAERN
ncbi:MAG TPA: sigma 54-interacting transcriptional regulator, partial [Polyangia bacterium]|nr:sigma 54-interacting transcriptional regulator [Polyangia bacterium]